MESFRCGIMWRVPLRRLHSVWSSTGRGLTNWSHSPCSSLAGNGSASKLNLLNQQMKQASLGKFFSSKSKPASEGDRSKSVASAEKGSKAAAQRKPLIEKELIPQKQSEDGPSSPSKPLKRLRKAPKEIASVKESDTLQSSQPGEAAQATPPRATPADKQNAATGPASQEEGKSQSARQQGLERESSAAGPAPDGAQQMDLSPAKMAAAAQAVFLDQPSSTGKPEAAKPSMSASPKKRKRKTAELGSDDETAAEEAPAKAEAASPAKKKKAVLKYKAPTKKVEGVGQGALAAAALHTDFDLDQVAPWPNGAEVPFSYLAAAFEAIGKDSRRLAKTQQLVALFRGIIARTPEDLLPTVYLCTNQVAPAHTGIELGIGDAILIKALAQATGSQEKNVKKEYNDTGDLGSVASSLRQTQKTMFQKKPLTVRGVHKTFKDIASTEGSGSQDKKKGLIQGLLVASKQNEPSFIMRALQGKLRIGLGAETVLVALAHAVLLHKTSDQTDTADLANRLEQTSQAIKLAYSQCPDYGVLISALLEHPVQEVNQHVHFIAGVPIQPMLAKPTLGVSEVLDKFQDTEFTCEYKYDGERAQIHITEEGKISIFSRNSENNTSKYPDLIAALPNQLQSGVTSAVLDCEAVAYDHENHKILPFQVLSTRARKDVKVEDIKVRVCLYVFDCLYRNGETLLQRPLSERRELLRQTVTEKTGQLNLATMKTSTDVEELQNFLDESVAAGTEGLIVKTMDSTYEPSRRSAHWLKLKKDYLKDCGDTFDVVPIGAWHGRGKRTGVYGSYLLAIYHEENEEYETISKIGTGFSDQQLVELSDDLNKHIIAKPPPYYKTVEKLIPDVWFDPKFVWEVKAADLSVSPIYPAARGLVDNSKGISIRFPRLIRVRTDKNPEQATTAEQVAEMYRKQAVLAQQKKKGAAAADDDF